MLTAVLLLSAELTWVLLFRSIMDEKKNSNSKYKSWNEEVKCRICKIKVLRKNYGAHIRNVHPGIQVDNAV